MHDPQPVLARTLHGIEDIAASEVRSLLGGERIEIGHRELRFSAPLPTTAGLGTVDDVFLILGAVDGVARRRESLARLRSLSLDLGETARLLGRGGPRTFDVTASFLGRRNYSRFELEDALPVPSGWTRVPRRGGLSLRIHVAGALATIAARVARTPLHRRAYRVATVRGSVHPPLARALALLAGTAFVDPFCGAGTIPIEGALTGLAASGSDLDPSAVAVASRNAEAAGVRIAFSVADAAALDEVDCVVTNPPWGRAVARTGVPLPTARRLVLLTAERPNLANVVHERVVRVHGALATITVAER